LEARVFNDPKVLYRLIIYGAVFGLVLSLWLFCVLLWATRRAKRKREMDQRLSGVAVNAPGQGSGRVLRLWRDGVENTLLVSGEGSQSGMITYLERLRSDAGWEASLASTFLGFLLVLGLVGAVTFLFNSSFLAAAMSMVAAALISWIYVTQRIARRIAIFERQFVDALSLAARSLRVGHPLAGAFRLISDEIPAPVGALFAEVCQQQDLGVPMERALRVVAQNNHSDDLKLFSTSVVIQLRSGGNLADMMERLVNVIRERNRLARRVKVLTAQTQLSKRVLLTLPFLVFVMLYVLNPTYMQPLFSTMTGELILVVAAAGLMVGWLTMNWISRLTV
jgi:tight adherence protein B